jgi:hypothetical protein
MRTASGRSWSLTGSSRANPSPGIRPRRGVKSRGAVIDARIGGDDVTGRERDQIASQGRKGDMRFTGAGAVLAVGLAAAGCSASHSSPSTRLAPLGPVQSVPATACGDSSRLAPAPLPLETGVYTSGPATVALGEDLAQLRARRWPHPFGSEAIALLAGRRSVTLASSHRPVSGFRSSSCPPPVPGTRCPCLATGDGPFAFPPAAAPLAVSGAASWPPDAGVPAWRCSRPARGR